MTRRTVESAMKLANDSLSSHMLWQPETLHKLNGNWYATTRANVPDSHWHKLWLGRTLQRALYTVQYCSKV